jgi:hypothetical protein
MLDNSREFQAGPDPFGRTWQVHFSWLQTGISIRHADTVDVKFGISTEGEAFDERVVALPHPTLLAVSQKVGHPLTDAWCLKLAALHLRHMLTSGEDGAAGGNRAVREGVAEGRGVGEVAQFDRRGDHSTASQQPSQVLSVSGVSNKESESHPEQTLPMILRMAREN